MRMDRQDSDDNHDRGNGRRLRPPVFDTSMAGDGGSKEEKKPADDDHPDSSQNRLTKSR
jgi:hypothetical protein